jgi:phosphoribosylanthranilate isomerase
LNPDNVEEAIRSEFPDGVDTASGVEASPGVKSPQKVAAFVKNAWTALRQIEQRR